jgi:copper transport protein
VAACAALPSAAHADGDPASDFLITQQVFFGFGQNATPSKALAEAGNPSARVGPGPVTRVLTRGGYRLEVRLDPKRAAVPNDFSVRITRDGAPVRGADVTTSFIMLDMEMGQQAYHLAETAPGVYSHSAPALVMVGHWGLSFDVRPPGTAPVDVLLLDRANG